jgi:DNA-binding response OmpR family regulator/anti-sigma regulatory factor (Ser/Thr protein kinase)
MNFRKVADSVIKLRVRPMNLSGFIGDLSGEFHDLATSKKISFSVIEDEDLHPYWLDHQVVEKVLFNLLNNAFKYTAEDGVVTLQVFSDWSRFTPAYIHEFRLLNEHRSERYVYIRIADTGIGISKESISNIFDRYYRVSNHHLGSGVGLALVKSLTVLHKGDIYVYSESNKGTEIVIALPWREEDYLAAEKGGGGDGSGVPRLEKIDNNISAASTLPKNCYEASIPGEDIRQHILLVEDNEELRAFLKEVMQENYHVYEAANGKEGLEMAMDKMPDLIISDVMMPLMNGVELCRQVKEKFETSHIPVIILSAKDALEEKLEGMGSGADYYFGKPLSTDLLLMTVHNIFEQKQRLKNKYTRDYYVDATELVHSSKDKEFIQRLLEQIEANIQNTDLDVDLLCQRMFISRTKLYQKINSISGQSVGEFIRSVRLKRAVHIMTHEEVSIYEVTERIGLQNSSYFAKIFKAEFGKSPAEFLRGISKIKE